MPLKINYPYSMYRFPKWAKIDAKSADIARYWLNGDGVAWEESRNIKPLPFNNHIEMSGLKASLIFSYGVDENQCAKRYIYAIFPKIRMYPNNTHSSLGYHFKEVKIRGKLKEKVTKIEFNGVLTTKSLIDKIDVERSIAPARNAMAIVEKIVFSNSSDTAQRCAVDNIKPISKVSKVFAFNDKPIYLNTTIFDNGKPTDNNFVVNLAPNESRTLYVAYSAESESVDAQAEFLARKNFLTSLKPKLKITTPNQDINQMLQFTKLRACESIFDTKGGYMHAPGGGGFYAAMWTNDQCEYANPYFAYVGYDIAELSAINSFEWFSKYIKPDAPIVSSIIAEGDGVWHGAGDRGDNAMYVYGLTRYIMTTGNKQMALEYIDKLQMATQYFIDKINNDGVVESDSDELENRFESGSANLSTSCIAYDALISLSYLLDDLAMSGKAKQYMSIAKNLKESISKYFESVVEGYDTYRYCKQEKALRSWVCLPLTVGIFDKAEGSISAVMSDKLLKGNGILTRSGEKTYWDRSGLYAMRGMFMAGQADTALKLLEKYTASRLFDEHMPYPVEAYPEGNGAHLSAESALYQRIFTEGILGYRPLGLSRFELAPNLPSKWDCLSIENMQLCGKPTSFVISKTNNGWKVMFNCAEYHVPFGEKLVLSY